MHSEGSTLRVVVTFGAEVVGVVTTFSVVVLVILMVFVVVSVVVGPAVTVPHLSQRTGQASKMGLITQCLAVKISHPTLFAQTV